MEQRQLYLDLLRVISIFAVIIIHVSAPLHELVKTSSNAWIFVNVFDSISRFSVPVFFMISGSLILNNPKNYQYSYLFSKRILRILIPLIFWSFFYFYVFNPEKLLFSNLWQTTQELLIKPAAYHLWFLYSLIGLYVITPFLGTILNKKSIYYILIGWVLFILFNIILRLFTGYHLPHNLHYFFSGIILFSGYFILGLYLQKEKLDFSISKLITIILISVSMSVLITHYFSYKNIVLYNILYSYISPNVLLISACIFLLIKELTPYLKINYNLLITLSDLSFGIYLMHIIILNQVNVRLHLDGNTFHPAIGILLTSICVFVISAILTYMIRQIPFIGKWVT